MIHPNPPSQTGQDRDIIYVPVCCYSEMSPETGALPTMSQKPVQGKMEGAGGRVGLYKAGSNKIYMFSEHCTPNECSAYTTPKEGRRVRPETLNPRNTNNMMNTTRSIRAQTQIMTGRPFDIIIRGVVSDPPLMIHPNPPSRTGQDRDILLCSDVSLLRNVARNRNQPCPPECT